MMEKIGVPMLSENILLLITGIRVTLLVWAGAALCSLIVGTLCGLICCPAVRVPVIAPGISGFLLVLRGIPFYVQLLIAYFVLPAFFGFETVNAPLIATLALGFCSAAYTSQAIISGINGINSSQWETAFVQGYSTIQTIRYVILPQLLPAIAPSLAAEADQLMKSTALFSSIGIMELTGMARNIIARELNPIPVYLTIALIYLIISLGINWFIHYARTSWGRYAKN